VICTATQCTYTPDTGYTGTDSYTYTITDSNGNTSNATVNVTIGGIFDPPTAIKTFNDAGLPELEFRMVWINSDNTAAINVQVTDQIPTGTAYVPGSISCVPQGSSATVNVITVPVPISPLIAAVPNWSCGFDAVHNQIQWQGTIGPDNGHLTEATAQNEVIITFRVTVSDAVNLVQNRALARTDVNNNGNFDEETSFGTSIVSSNQVIWSRGTSAGNSDPGKDKDTKFPRILPATGFAPNTITKLPPMPDGFAYAKTSIWLEVQKLGVKMNIVGVPFDNDKGKWNLTWLNTEAGWLENTAYPTHAGNSAITSHVTLANGLPGPFARLSTLSYGDQIVVHLDGQKYIYEVRDTKRVRPDAVNSVLKHEEHPWLTLITCQSYNEKANEYTYRTVVRAVLVKVIPE
jgi:LPXTG-site transpeptidase (sortase) family protein